MGKKYMVQQNAMNDYRYIVFEAVASGRYVFDHPKYQKGKVAFFKAMQMKDSEVWLWVDVGHHFSSGLMRVPHNVQLLKTLKVGGELTFDEIYELVINYV